MSNKMIIAAISSVLAVGISSVSKAAEDKPATHDMMSNIPGMEKCYGVAKAGRNDCGTLSHNCGGESKIDNEKEAWVLMPSGLCDKIAGSSTKPPQKA